jgi:hypothetical protein
MIYPNTKRLPERRQVAVGISWGIPGRKNPQSFVDLVYVFLGLAIEMKSISECS